MSEGSQIRTGRLDRLAGARPARLPSFQGATVLQAGNAAPYLACAAQPRDTLASIAARTGSDVESLQTYNNISDPNRVAGLTIKLPLTWHMVTWGDTYLSIAQRISANPTSMAELLKALNVDRNGNPIPEPLQFGTNLAVPPVDVGARRSMRSTLAQISDLRADLECNTLYGQRYATSHVGHTLGFQRGGLLQRAYQFNDDFTQVRELFNGLVVNAAVLADSVAGFTALQGQALLIPIAQAWRRNSGSRAQVRGPSLTSDDKVQMTLSEGPGARQYLYTWDPRAQTLQIHQTGGGDPDGDETDPNVDMRTLVTSVAGRLNVALPLGSRLRPAAEADDFN
jgi:hypothetical protein